MYQSFNVNEFSLPQPERYKCRSITLHACQTWVRIIRHDPFRMHAGCHGNILVGKKEENCLRVRVAKLRVTWGFLCKLRKLLRKLVNYIFKMANLKRVYTGVYVSSLVVFVYAIIIIFEIWICILLDLTTVEIKIKI